MTAAAGSRPEGTSQPGTLNLPNTLTVLRLLLVPVFVVLLMHEDGKDDSWRVAAWAVFALAAVTDLVDGDIARRYGSVTEFGKLIDPIADKALIGASLVSLSVLGDLPWVLTAVVLVRELGVTALRFWVIRHGVMPASRGGKVKTVLQAVAIGLFLLPHPGAFGVLAWAFMIAAVAVTIGTGVDYVFRAMQMRRALRAA